VVESAEAGDEVANKILHNSVGELASSVKAVVQRLALSGEGEHGNFFLNDIHNRPCTNIQGTFS
jgi:N-acetylglucosamine kinase-like BadF-type ATPase